MMSRVGRIQYFSPCAIIACLEKEIDTLTNLHPNLSTYHQCHHDTINLMFHRFPSVMETNLDCVTLMFFVCLSTLTFYTSLS